MASPMFVTSLCSIVCLIRTLELGAVSLDGMFAFMDPIVVDGAYKLQNILGLIVKSYSSYRLTCLVDICMLNAVYY